MRLSLRTMVPLLVLFLAFLQGLFFYTFSLREINQRITTESVQDLSVTLARLQGTLGYLFRRNDIDQVQEEIAALGEDTRLRFAMLIDESDRVLASIRISDRGLSVGEALERFRPGVRGLLAERLQDARSRMSGSVRIIPEVGCISGIYPVVLGGDESALRPTRQGLLLACMDVGFSQQLVEHELNRKMVPVALALLAAALLLALLFHLLISKRVQRLLAATASLAGGDYSARAGVAGSDELGRLSAAFDEMAGEVALAHQRLRERETRFRAIFNSTFQFTGLLDPEGTLLEANESSLAIVDADAAEVIGRPFWEAPWWKSEKDVERLKAAIAEAAEGGFVRFETVHESARGETIVVDFSLTPIRDERGHVILLVPEGRDITDLKNIVQEREHLAHELELAELQWERAMEFFADPVFLTDIHTRIIQANKAFYDFLSLAQDSVIGRHVAEVMHPGGGHAGCPACRAHADLRDSLFTMEASHPDNPVGRPIEITTRVIRDAAGEPQGMLAGIRDLTRQREMEAELRQHRDHLEEMVKRRTASLVASNRELESFSYSVSHDLRSPLRAINGYSQFILDDYSDVLDDTARDYLKRMMAASERMGRLIDDLLQLAKMTRKELVYESVDLSAMVREIVDSLRDAEPQRKVHAEIEAGIRVEGDSGLLLVMMENLISNAWKFTRERDPAVIRFGRRESEVDHVYYVSDNGVGFDLRYSQNLFKPFYRLHAADDFAGTGIGLATVARIVERHRGHVWAEAEPDEGATFLFSLEA